MNYNDYGSCVVESTTPGVMTSTNTVDTTVVNGVAVNAGKCLNGTGGKGLGGNYKLYRFYDPATYDEELQVWSWNQSYATQYRDVTASGNDPQHQAWSFGGNYTTAANMPTSGQVNYVGQWTATAKTAGFLKNPVGIQVPILDGNGVWTGALGQIIQKVQPSNDWRVSGNSALTADFGAGTLTGRLHSNNWQGLDLVNNHYNVDPNAAAAATADCLKLINSCSPLTLSGQATLQNWLNYNATFMSTEVVLKGAIKTYPPKPTNPPTPPAATTTNKENQVVGTAAMDPNNGWLTINGLNPMYAGFFGTVTAGKPQEVTGAFALKSTVTLPNGGTGINNDQRATIEMSGIFNGQ